MSHSQKAQIELEYAFAISNGRGKRDIFGAPDPESRDKWTQLIRDQVDAFQTVLKRPERYVAISEL